MFGFVFMARFCWLLVHSMVLLVCFFVCSRCCCKLVTNFVWLCYLASYVEARCTFHSSHVIFFLSLLSSSQATKLSELLATSKKAKPKEKPPLWDHHVFFYLLIIKTLGSSRYQSLLLGPTKKKLRS